MRLRLVCVGRRARDPLLDVADDYLKRLQHYTQVELHRVKETRDRKKDERELCAAIASPGHLVAMDERGESLRTQDLVTRIERWQRAGYGTVSLVIGGADGLPKTVLENAKESIALSKMTLPHRMALMLLAEQLYRAHTIMRGEPYHRD